MKALLYRDGIRGALWAIILGIGYMFVLAGTFQDLATARIRYVPLLMLPLYLLSLFEGEASSRMDDYFLSATISRRTLVTERFLFPWMTIGGLLMLALLHLIRGSDAVSILVHVSFLVGMSLILALELLLIYRLGFRAGYGYMIAIYILTIIGVFLMKIDGAHLIRVSVLAHTPVRSIWGICAGGILLNILAWRAAWR